MAFCPNCGRNNMKYFREPVEIPDHNYDPVTGIKGGRPFPSGIKKGRQKIVYRTVGLCSNCGYTKEIESEKGHSRWWYILFFAFLPVSLSVWFWLTDIFSLEKKWRALILFIAWLSFIISVRYYQARKEPEPEPEVKSVWASDLTGLNDFEYYTDGNEIYIKDYKGRSKKIRFDSSYDIEGTVMHIVSFDETFALEKLVSVIIPDGTRYMSNKVFNACRIEFLYLPASLENFDGWSSFRDVQKIYYGGTEEQWNALCTVDRTELDVVEIIFDTDPNDLR